jgi:glyoxylase-like metal-dependent hydrolase (beta-lactamase superfamily II)
MRLPLCLLATTALIACSAEAPQEEASQATENTARTGIEMYVMDCGTIEISDIGVFSTAGDYDGQSDTFADGCFLIRHPEGDLLWDLGLPAALIDSGPQTNGVFTVSLEKTLTEQLGKLGSKPADIEFISISHNHFDHVGQVEQFPGATWLVHENEYAAMFGGETVDPSHAPFQNLQTTQFTGDYDVFGDGKVIILETPGHTPGHTSLLIDLPQTGPVLLTGDLYHRLESRALKRVPQFNTDAEQTIESMAVFETLATNLGARVIIQHSKADLAGLPQFPQPVK